MLHDIVVVEAGRRESAAWCGRLLADMGADVVRVDDADAVARDCGYESYLHAGKRRAAAVDGVGAVHIVVTDGPGPDTDGLLDHLRQVNSGLVVVSVTDYGTTGPDADTPASELTLQAEAGIVALHPTGDRPPVGMGIDLAEQTAGRWAAVAAVMGLLAVECGAPGTDVDVSRFESLVSVLQFPWLFAQFPDHFPYPVPQMAVPGIEPAKDGWVCVVAVSPQQWAEFKKLTGNTALDDDRFDALPERVRLVAELRPHIRAFTEQHTVVELVELGLAHRVPIVPVTTPKTVGDFAPYADRAVVVPTADGRFAHPGPPFRIHPDRRSGAASPVPTGSGTADRPLHGLRVLELGTFQAGPLVGAHLAALGADVVRVESIGKPDVIRFTGAAPTVDRFWERAGTYVGVNVGKRAITADLSDTDGRAVVEKLIAASDVLVENYVPRVLDGRGLDYEGVRALRPDIVMVRMPAWGSAGEWRDRPGFTYTANAASGLSWTTGYPDDEPLLTGSIVDPVAAMVATLVTLSAIRRRRHTGAGALVEVPLCDVALQLSARHIVEASAGPDAGRRGNRRDDVAPQGVYRAGDGRWVAVTVATVEQWQALCGLAGDRDWARDCSLADTAARVRRHAELDAHLATLCAEYDSGELVSTLRGRGVPAARVEIGTALTAHPQLRERQRVYSIDHPVVGRADYLGLPMRFSHGPTAVVDRPAPLFGQHSHEVLAELGYDAARIQGFVEAGLLGESPYGLPFAVADR